MKKFMFAAVAASMIASPILAAAPAAAAPQQRHMVVKHKPNGKVVVKQVRKQTYRPARVEYRNDWKRGQRFDSRYARNYRQVDYRQYRNLKAPPRGYHYVRSGNDAVLVGITSGIIAAVIAGAIR